VGRAEVTELVIVALAAIGLIFVVDAAFRQLKKRREKRRW
jgi:hypothetical protein